MIHRKVYQMVIFICLIVLPTALMSAGCSNATPMSSAIYSRTPNIDTAEESKQLLREGNQRFVSGNVLNDDLSLDKRTELSEYGQHPFAVIVSCSDSRVPPEILFDQSLGDLFVIRNAGNVIDAISLGSIEYAAEHLETPLILVLGHENCGAVKAVVDGIEAQGNLPAILKKIQPAYEKAKLDTLDQSDLYEKCAEENVHQSIAEIRESTIIQHLEHEKKLEIIGGKYNLQTGEVYFF
ncbi:carbonic anhydrase [Dehalobacter sp. DCM]|uniref:carbonic anhydrase n=1 Tax=Dehalobacter sp. DCM TaxID=2907827 RepID=UPI0030816E31|nr:carbonic anhydrase [Dehalobacter sp. DCM]